LQPSKLQGFLGVSNPLATNQPPTTNRINTMKNTQTETATAFKSRLSDYDKESQWQYTFQAKAVLEKLDQALIRLYDAGCLDLSDFKRFDDMILSRQIKLQS
tara:strand:- start:146 stop:451 length:306 start_codon:yes stop_codon:yes gene_type:complete